jgi:hypothetical protein
MSDAKSVFRTKLDAALHAAFVDGVQWPLEEASLTALVDLGLSDAQIASYFAVDTADVRSCKQKLGLGGG